MLGALTSLTGGGGMSASSSSSNEQRSANDISSGTITVGGLNMGSPPNAFNADMVLKGGVVVAIGLGAVWALKAMR